VLEWGAPWLFLLLPLPWLVRRFLPAHREPRPSIRVPFMVVLQRVGGEAGETGAAVNRRLRLQWWLLGLCWLALVVALARPLWLGEPIVREKPMRDLLIALDLSGSMDTQDFSDVDGQVTDRLTAAQQVLDDFLAGREGDRAGLIFFGTAAFVQVPFTDDIGVVRELLGEARVRMLGPRTAMGDAIGAAIGLFQRSEVDERVLIVLTDGNDTGSMLPPARAAEIAADNGVVIHTVAMGDPEAAGEQALDEATLNAVANATGGRFFRAGDRSGLEEVYAALDEINPRRVETRSYRPRHELFQWPLGFATVFSMLIIGLGSLIGSRRLPGRGDA
jgi:Ca-activated chloride channel family protein